MKGLAESKKMEAAKDVIFDLIRNGTYCQGQAFTDKRADGWVMELRKEDPL